MFKQVYILILFLLCSFTTTQNDLVKISWKQLEQVEYENKYLEQLKGYMLYPKFGQALVALNNQQVEITGYVVPFDKEGQKIALSAYPYAACFFCGKAGPASVLTIKLKKANKKYKTDQYKTFKGRLKLNETDIAEFYYILEEGEEK